MLIDIPLVSREKVVPEIKRLGKEPVGAKPIIPTEDDCCAGVCTLLNNEVNTIDQVINIRKEELKFMYAGESKLKTRRQITALTNKISVLKDMRYSLLEKNVCKCIEPITEKSHIEIPLIKK